MDAQLAQQSNDHVNYDGSSINTSNITSKEWREVHLKKLATRCSSHQKELDLIDSEAVNISSMLFTIAKGLYLQRKPENYTTMTQREKEEYGTELAGFFNQELKEAENYIKDTFDPDVNFAKKSGTWASTVSRINSCLQAGVDLSEKDSFGNWKVNTVKDAQNVKKEMKEAKIKASDDNAAIKLKAEKDQTESGKLENYKASVLGELGDIIDKCKTVTEIHQIFIQSNLLTKLGNAMVAAKRLDENSRDELQSKWQAKRKEANNPSPASEIVAKQVDSTLEASQEAHSEALAQKLDHHSDNDNVTQEATQEALNTEQL